MVHSVSISQYEAERRTRIQNDGEQHETFDYISEVSPSVICNDDDHGF